MKTYYLVHKLYKGIFRKKFKGNMSVLVIPIASFDTSLFSILGIVEDKKDTYVATMVSHDEPELIEQYIEQLDPDGSTVLMAESNCSRKRDSKGKGFIYTVNKPGKYFPKVFSLSGYDFDGEIYYFLKGKFNFVSVDEDLSPKQYKMAAIKKSAFLGKLKSLVSSFKRK